MDQEALEAVKSSVAGLRDHMRRIEADIRAQKEGASVELLVESGRAVVVLTEIIERLVDALGKKAA